MSEVSVTRFERKLRAILGAARGTLLPRGVDDHIQGLVLLEGDRPEWGYPGGEHLWGGIVGAGLSATQFSAIGVFNPPASGVTAIVEDAENLTAPGVEVRSVFAQSELTTIAAMASASLFPRDIRQRNPALSQSDFSPVRLFSTNTLGAPLGQITWRLRGTSVPDRWPVMVLPPNSAVMIVPFAVNQANDCVFSVRTVGLEGGTLG